MFKQKYILEAKGKEDRLYRFECDVTAPLGELNDVLFSMKSVVMKQLNEQHEKERVEEKESNEPLGLKTKQEKEKVKA